MKINSQISPAIIAAAATLLGPYVQNLTPGTLVEALKAFNGNAACPQSSRDTLTISDTAKLLRVSEMTIHRMLKSGQLPRIQFAGRTVRIPASAIDVLLAGNTQTTDAPPDL